MIAKDLRAGGFGAGLREAKTVFTASEGTIQSPDRLEPMKEVSMRNVITTVITAILLTGCSPTLAENAAGSRNSPPNVFNTNGNTFVVNNQAAKASDKNPGTEAMPLKTIQAAANLARPGDTILVKAGIYREEVIPPRGGASAARPITYRAARGAEVSIRGSERITNWTDQGGGVWMVELDTAFFKGYNPFAMKVFGKWISTERRAIIKMFKDNKITVYTPNVQQRANTVRAGY